MAPRCPLQGKHRKALGSQDSTQRYARSYRWNTNGTGSPNYEMDERTFLLNRERAVDYLNMLDRLYVFDGYAGWDPEVPRCLLLCTSAF